MPATSTSRSVCLKPCCRSFSGATTLISSVTGGRVSGTRSWACVATPLSGLKGGNSGSSVNESWLFWYCSYRREPMKEIPPPASTAARKSRIFRVSEYSRVYRAKKSLAFAVVCSATCFSDLPRHSATVFNTCTRLAGSLRRVFGLGLIVRGSR